MSAWTPVTGVEALRRVLSDGPLDKLRFRKKVIGQVNGVNKAFKTFELRRITPFIAALGTPLGVFDYQGVLQAVDVEDLPSGAFNVTTAPVDGDALYATYYVQWFTDIELTQFLSNAAVWAGFTLIESVPDQFQPAALEYAAFQAYQNLCQRFAENLSETYQLYDAPDKERWNPVDAWMKIAKQKYDLAVKLRDDVYERKGQAKAPLFGTIAGRVRDVAPKR